VDSALARTAHTNGCDSRPDEWIRELCMEKHGPVVNRVVDLCDSPDSDAVGPDTDLAPVRDSTVSGVLRMESNRSL